MGVVSAWFIGAAYISYRYGWKCKALPTPHRFIALTAFMSIAGLVSMADETTGTLFSYGSLIAMILYGQTKPKTDKSDCDQPKPKAISSNQSSNQSPKLSPSQPSSPHVYLPQPVAG